MKEYPLGPLTQHLTQREIRAGRRRRFAWWELALVLIATVPYVVAMALPFFFGE